MSKKRIYVRDEDGNLKPSWGENEAWGHIPQHGHGGALVVGSSNPDQEAARRYRAKKREEKAA